MEKLSSSKEVAENKLLILYILDKIKIDAGGVDLTDYVLGQRLMNFFSFQQYLNELIQSGHVEKLETDGKARYAAAAKGSELLSLMSGLLPETEKNRIDRTFKKLHRRTLNERAVTAEYTPDDEHTGVVRIELNEGDFSLLSMRIATASKADAVAMCRNWKAGAPEIYAEIINLLLGAAREAGPDEQPQRSE